MTLRSNSWRVRTIKVKCDHPATRLDETLTHRLIVCANPDCGRVVMSRRLDAFTGKGRS